MVRFCMQAVDYNAKSLEIIKVVQKRLWNGFWRLQHQARQKREFCGRLNLISNDTN